ncbi:MAG: tRNA 2-thiouridine(34) synthase MnmA [Proteobacteria bacterium]|nr:tRNA 2-thiouridine(34) synthase MnmA [Pseudomonadota bacterium]
MKIAALVSGGVDSSVVLGLLAREGGHDITAFYLKIWLEDELHFLGECPWAEDLKYVRAVCDQLNIPLQVVSLQREYNERVVSYTLAELKAGRTPSPDIFCNQRIKFGAFFDHIDESYDRIATGHYASTYEQDNQVYLRQGVDPVKDQSYFLSHLSQEQLKKCLFPLGPLPKTAVRIMAQEMNLATKDRPDSQGICFLGKIKYNDKHQGFWFHTYGHRKGLRLHGGPWFVVDKDPERNIVYVSHMDLLAAYARTEYIAINIQWNSNEPVLSGLKVKVRHGPKQIPCHVTKISDDSYHVKLSEPDVGLAHGQFSVFYGGDTCLGSGVISLLPLKDTSET